MARVAWLRTAGLSACIAAAAAVAHPLAAEPRQPMRPAAGDRAPPAGEAQRRPELARLLGVWRGAYVCAQGLTGLTLIISEGADGLQAEFQFYAVPQNPGVPSGRFRMTGAYEGGMLTLRPGPWIEGPSGYVTVALRMLVDIDAGEMSGSVDGPGCGPVRVTRGLATSQRSGPPHRG